MWPHRCSECQEFCQYKCHHYQLRAAQPGDTLQDPHKTRALQLQRPARSTATHAASESRSDGTLVRAPLAAMPCEAENAQTQLAMLRKHTQEVTESARRVREHCDQQLAERATEVRELQARMAQVQSEAWRLEAALRTQLQREAAMKAEAEAQADAEARASMQRRKEVFGWADMGIRSPNGAMERVEAAERHAAHEAALRQEAERLQEKLCAEHDEAREHQPSYPLQNASRPRLIVHYIGIRTPGLGVLWILARRQ